MADGDKFIDCLETCIRLAEEMTGGDEQLEVLEAIADCCLEAAESLVAGGDRDGADLCLGMLRDIVESHEGISAASPAR